MRLRTPRALLLAALLALVAGAAPARAEAANACLAAAGGIGGTGSPVQGGGAGGTGHGPEEGGVGATGRTAEEGGIGGTGHAAEEGGIGGTGQTADKGGIGGTGIVGVITGFASVCVGGLEVHYDERTAVTRNGSPAGLSDLAVGHVVSIEAHPGKAGLTAQRVAVLDAVVGPVSGASADAIEVMGQRVRVTAETVRADGGGAPKLGDVLRISGQRTADGTVVATRVERGRGDSASILGTVQRTAPGSFQVAGVRVDTPSSAAILSPNREVLAVGRWDGSRLVASRVSADPTHGFGPRVDRLVLEGFVIDVGKSGRVNVGGRDLRVGPSTRFSGGDGRALDRDQRVRISASIGADGAARVERVQYRRELFSPGERGLRGTPEPGRGSDPGAGRSDGAESGGKSDRDQKHESRADKPGGSDGSHGNGAGQDRAGDRRDDARTSGSSGDASRGGTDRAGGGRSEDIGRDRSSRPDRPARTERFERNRDH